MSVKNIHRRETSLKHIVSDVDISSKIQHDSIITMSAGFSLISSMYTYLQSSSMARIQQAFLGREFDLNFGNKSKRQPFMDRDFNLILSTKLCLL